jgi:hypothetical protein
MNDFGLIRWLDLKLQDTNFFSQTCKNQAFSRFNDDGTRPELLPECRIVKAET